MYALFFSETADKIYYYQVGQDKGNEQGFYTRKSLMSDFYNKSSIIVSQ